MKAVIAAIAALATAVPAWAAEPVNPLARATATVSVKGLDLASVDGQRQLAIRMDEAARAVCGDRVATIHLSLNEQSRACQVEVKAEIRSKIEARTASTGTFGAPTLLAAR